MQRVAPRLGDNKVLKAFCLSLDRAHAVPGHRVNFIDPSSTPVQSSGVKQMEWVRWTGINEH